MEKNKQPLISVLISERFVMSLIVINTLSLFFYEFPSIRHQIGDYLLWVDRICISLFILEATLKLQGLRTKYFQNSWNIFDFTVTVLSVPSLVIIFANGEEWSWLASASIIRAGRLLRFLRLLKFIPNSEHLLEGIVRALKASVGVFLTLILLNITLALTATMFFGPFSPEYFGDPIKSSYSLLKMFTVEGWYDIPDEVAGANPESWMGTLLRGYAILTVLVGGILGMSLANAVFVDEMTSDNNAKLEDMVESLHKKMDHLSEEIKILKGDSDS